MKFRDFLNNAFKNLVKRKMRTTLTVVAISVGTMLLMIMVCLGYGAKQFLMDSAKTQVNLSSLQVFPIMSGTAGSKPASPGQTITAKNDGESKLITEDNVEKIKKIKGVSEVKEIIITDPITVTIGDKSARDTHADGYNVKYGVFAENFIEGMRLTTNDKGLNPIAAGRDLEETDENSALVNTQYLKRFGITDYKSVIGKNITIEADKGQSMGTSVPGKSYTAKIVGVVDSNFFSAGDLIIPIGLVADIQGFISGSSDYYNVNGPEQLIVYTNSFNDVSGVAGKVRELGYTTVTKDESISEIKRLSAILMGVMASVGAIILGIAAIGVINTMVMSIYERTRSIGIMKSLGASNSDIRNLFLIESGMIGFIGGVFGAGIGVAAIEIAQIALSGYMYSQGFNSVNLFSIRFSIILGSIIFSTVIALISGLYPAGKAARLSPMEALRYE